MKIRPYKTFLKRAAMETIRAVQICGGSLGSISGNTANLQRARAIWKLTCENYSSIVGACGNLGVMFEKGQGGPQDSQMALQLYDRDCRRGGSWACTNYYYLEGSLNTETWIFNPPNVNQRVT